MKTEDIGEEADGHAIRHIIFTEKGKYYELEQVNDLFISLRNITEKTLTLLSIHASYDVIRNNYHSDLSFSNFSYLSKILLVASATAMPVVIVSSK
jgi:hypothetical protein